MQSISNRRAIYNINFSIFFGSLYLLFLFFTISNNTFYSGDAGIKFLLIKQFATGCFDVALNLEVPEWVENIWLKGYYPFTQPFVYSNGKENIVSFPFLFQLLNIIPYKYLGIKGMYIIPMISVLVSWIYLKSILEDIGVNKKYREISIFIFVFSTPFTLYAAIYWEHSIAVLFILSGLEMILKEDIKFPILKGVFFGLSTWFRPEAIIFCGLVIIYLTLRNKESKRCIFILPAIATILLFFVTNYLVYNHFLGIHSYQVIHEKHDKITQAYNFFKIDSYLLIRYFPLTITSIFILKLKLKKNDSVKHLFAVGVIFMILVCFFIPNHGGKQWGPRYFLFLIPCILIVISFLWQNISKVNLTNKVKTIIYYLSILLIVFGCYWNTYVGYIYIRNDYKNRVRPGIKALLETKNELVLVNDQLIGQEFTTVFDKKYFFLVDNSKKLTNLISLLIKEKKYFFIYATIEPEKPIDLQNRVKTVNAPYKYGAYYFAEYEIISD
ncbi:LA_3751/LA_3752 family putative glycosyltransferase [Chondrinema litorale]|uniref:LA_3751/LA_3752 family putative glycosyltransferase n=1 Tax=Chondrinema litorale TaxID=2994555 RepID=UPI002543A65E|nr:hypothetical protein [Chondrinema litorale]UZS00103.1 hypothetical protein OQ292_40040 [Chondrinema litorale]